MFASIVGTQSGKRRLVGATVGRGCGAGGHNAIRLAWRGKRVYIWNVRGSDGGRVCTKGHSVSCEIGWLAIALSFWEGFCGTVGYALAAGRPVI